jgi:hypothetical protein
MTDKPRMILAVATEADDKTKFIWERLKVIQPDLFAIGPIHIKFAYFGAEDDSHVRPCITTDWITNADDVRDMMDRGCAQCVCGCYINLGNILERTLQEAQQGRPVQAVVIIGDYFHDDLNAALATAKQLRAVGTRLFLFQQKRDGLVCNSVEKFKALAEMTGGAFFQFNPQIERIAEQLPETMQALTHFAVGGMDALEAQAQGNESAVLLLEQMTDQDTRQIAHQR